MKLYATTTSERAFKGQGGNEYLQIQISGEDEIIFGSLTVLPSKRVYGSIHGQKIDIEYRLKGKAGNLTCHSCISKFYGLEGKEDTCPKCLKKLLKGEVCHRHGTQYIERHKLDGRYICRSCVVDSVIETKGKNQTGDECKKYGCIKGAHNCIPF